MERMKLAGREMSRSDVSAVAKESKILLLQRLHMGGLHMPPPTLSDAEIRSLVAYLELLSDIPGAANRQIAVRESSYRVGEHIVKSTCHVCHSATGANPDTEQIYEGAIPPLSSLTSRVSLPDFVRKVTAGTPIMMGTPPALYRGRMPVFSYLTQDEAAAAYLYLMLYPPKP
jgi:mono/diheme cytochrome c family protein